MVPEVSGNHRNGSGNDGMVPGFDYIIFID
jgi:hypothetical protein